MHDKSARHCPLMLTGIIVVSFMMMPTKAPALEHRYSLDPSHTIAEYALQLLPGTGHRSGESAQATAPVADVIRLMVDRQKLFPYLGGAAALFIVGLVGVHVCRRYHRRTLATARLQAELSRAQLQAMKAQLQPHFLFNTLNTISVLVTENPAKANRMIILLSDLLRQTFEMSQADEVTLRRELELLRAYIEIQRMRFKRRLSVSYDVNVDILDAKLPNFTLQPIVENAIRHGIAKQVKGGRIEIRAHRTNGHLVLQVQDDGPGLSLEQMRERNGNGVGLANTSKRLACIYGSSSSFSIQSRKPNGTVATIVIPYHESGKPS